MKDRIKTLMESQHMTQQVFADFLGINPATLSGIFNDRTKPTINIVEAVRKKFPDISLDWLMFGSGSMYKSEASSTGTGTTTPSESPSSAQQQQLWTQEQVLDFGESPQRPSYAPTPQVSSPSVSHHNVARNPRQDFIREEVKIIDKPSRRVTEIRVYYDDPTWESFVPAKK